MGKRSKWKKKVARHLTDYEGKLPSFYTESTFDENSDDQFTRK